VDGWDSWDSWSFGDRQQSKQLPASAEKSWFGPESRMTARKQAKPNKQTSEEVFRIRGEGGFPHTCTLTHLVAGGLP